MAEGCKYCGGALEDRVGEAFGAVKEEWWAACVMNVGHWVSVVELER